MFEFNVGLHLTFQGKDYNKLDERIRERSRAADQRQSRERMIRWAFRAAGVPELLPERFRYTDPEAHARYLDITNDCPG
jgi:hypothetical protein